MSKVAKETVLDEHMDGSAHITVDEAGDLKHYAGGCALERSRAEARRSRRGGPPMVASNTYRNGWDAVSWGSKPGGAPS